MENQSSSVQGGDFIYFLVVFEIPLSDLNLGFVRKSNYNRSHS